MVNSKSPEQIRTDSEWGMYKGYEQNRSDMWQLAKKMQSYSLSYKLIWLYLRYLNKYEYKIQGYFRRHFERAIDLFRRDDIA